MLIRTARKSFYQVQNISNLVLRGQNVQSSHMTSLLLFWYLSTTFQRCTPNDCPGWFMSTPFYYMC